MNSDYFVKPSITGKEREVMLSVLADKWSSGILDWLGHLSTIGASFDACQLFWQAADRYKQGDREDMRTMRLLTQIKAFRFWDERNNRYSVYVYHWSRDCDLMEGDSVYTIPADIGAFNEREEHVWDNAEGPQRFYMISEADAAEFRPQWRDRAAEQMGY